MRPFACTPLWVATTFSILQEVTSIQVPAIPKLSAHDTEFTTTNNSGAPVRVPIPANTPIVWNVAGLHYNGKFPFLSVLATSFHHTVFRKILGRALPIQARKIRQG